MSKYAKYDIVQLTALYGNKQIVIMSVDESKPVNKYSTRNLTGRSQCEYVCGDSIIARKIGTVQPDHPFFANRPADNAVIASPTDAAASAAHVRKLKEGDDIKLRLPGGRVEVWTFQAFKSRRPKYPVVATNYNGKRYKFPLSAVVV